MKDMMSPESVNVGIVGNGRYGKFFRDFFQRQGHEVKVSDINTSPSNEDIVRWADVVIIAVTITEVTKVIRSVLSLLRPEQLIMDVASVKVAPVQAMLESEAEVVGLHPFCAPPSAGTFSGQTLFVSSSRVVRWKSWVQDFLNASEANVVIIDPQDHDRDRSVDQVLEHMCTLLKVSVMRRLGLDATRLVEVASPVYKLTSIQMARMFAQSSDLYGGIPMCNAYALDALRLFEEELRKYTAVVGSQSLSAYGREFHDNAVYLGKENIRKSLALSQEVIDFMKNISVARK